MAIFVAQEWAEGLLSAGHPSAVLEPLAHGGWVVVPLALVLGAAVALLVRGAELALARGGTRPRVGPGGPIVSAGLRVRVWRPRASLLALNLAGRAPPPLFV